MLPIHKDRYKGATRLKDLALIYVLLGRYDEAVDSLERIFSGPSETHIPEIRLDPLYAPLLDHPRFRSLRHEGHDCASL